MVKSIKEDNREFHNNMRKAVILTFINKGEKQMGKFIDLTGQKFGEMTIIEKDIELT